MRPQPIARLGKRRSSLRNSPVLARIAGSWQSGACYVQRAENPRALAFFSLSSSLLSVVLYYHLRSPSLLSLPSSLPLSLSLQSSQFLSPSLAARPENGMRPRRGLVFTPRRFYSPLSLYLFLARKSSRHLHNTLGDALFF